MRSASPEMAMMCAEPQMASLCAGAGPQMAMMSASSGVAASAQGSNNNDVAEMERRLAELLAMDSAPLSKAMA